MAFVGLVDTLVGIGGKALDRIFPDTEKAEEAKRIFLLEMANHSTELTKLGAENVKAEASSEGWLARSWRPITMLVFVGLIVARFLGFAAPNITESEYMKLWSLMEIGLGGYVVGRTAEKIVPVIMEGRKKNG